jgi:hypothetical protein
MPSTAEIWHKAEFLIMPSSFILLNIHRPSNVIALGIIRNSDRRVAILSSVLPAAHLCPFGKMASAQVFTSADAILPKGHELPEPAVCRKRIVADALCSPPTLRRREKCGCHSTP